MKPAPVVCPSCQGEVARHPWYVRQRVRALSCPHCGAQLEVVIPAFPHYATAVVIAIAAEVAALLLVLVLFRMWVYIVLAFGLVAAIELIRAAWLRRVAEVRWLNRESMKRQAAGRWIPG